MAELNTKQIVDRLNQEFQGDTRKLVFWYDDNGDFSEEVGSFALENAKLYRLEPDNTFYTKRFLEREDRTTNYLIYAPFPKPDVENNHLEDTWLYSRKFYADRLSLVMMDLKIHERYKRYLKAHEKFFANKDRVKRFYDLGIEDPREEDTIRTAMISCVCKAPVSSLEESIRMMLLEEDWKNNALLDELEKYDLLEDFWQLCRKHFGYTDPDPTLEKLVVTLFATCAAKQITEPVPQPWKPFVIPQSGNAVTFLSNLMNNIIYQERFDQLSRYVASGLQVDSVFSAMHPDALVDCDVFLAADKILVQWIVARLLAEDTGSKLQEYDIPAVCDKRMKLHFGKRTGKTYQLLLSAYHIVQAAQYQSPEGWKNIITRYQQTDWEIDFHYRRFYRYYDQLEDTGGLDQLRTLVENIYTNEYLEKLLPKWNEGIQDAEAFHQIPLQRNFFARHILPAKEKVVVIISDALRYEVGKELLRKMEDDPKCATAELAVQLSVLPSYTRLGMAALLPHNQLRMTDDFQVLVDDMPCDNLANRQTVLRKKVPNSTCVQFDDIKNLKKADLREIFTGNQVVYVYHNQIDARGDKPNTEDEVFVACEEAIQEIGDLIRRLNVSANAHAFIVTSDHGFLYKRDKVTETDKISGANVQQAFVNRRFIVAQSPVEEDGVQHLPMSRILNDQDDNKVVSFPVSDTVFKVAGGGQNFVHGGSSPQEMLVPVLKLKMERGRVETKNAGIALITIVNKITNLITSLEFLQTEPVSDVVKAASYKLFFASEDGEIVSNENTYVADHREEDTMKRMFRLRFTFKNQKYDSGKPYYLIVTDEATGLELFRKQVIMDLAFADDFGFGF